MSFAVAFSTNCERLFIFAVTTYHYMIFSVLACHKATRGATAIIQASPCGVLPDEAKRA
jgi:hypothetical protein